MVLNQNFPDVRVCQEIDALNESGYIVYVLISNSKQTSSPEYCKKDYNTIEIDLRVNIFEYYLNMLTFRYSSIYKKIVKNKELESLKNKVIAIHVHDLMWSNLGCRLSKYFKAKFIVDFHENYPALNEFVGNKPAKNLKEKIIRKLKSRNRMVKYEKRISKLADKIIVVVNENKERIVKEYKINPEKITIVSNTKDTKKYKNYGLNYSSGKINLLYHGSVQKLRGLRTLIKAFKKSENHFLNLTIVGFKKNCREKAYILSTYNDNLPVNITLHDWSTDREFIINEIIKSDLCVIPHDKSELSETTVPNKIFEYMCHGKALLVSDVGPLKRIVSNSDCGFIFESGNVDSLKKILSSLKCKQSIKKYSFNSRKMAELKYDWEYDKSSLVKLYSEL